MKRKRREKEGRREGKRQGKETEKGRKGRHVCAGLKASEQALILLEGGSVAFSQKRIVQSFFMAPFKHWILI